ncbi:MAG TPA: class I SAM-dependent methyltransferase [Rhizomicrobium sp.]|jgi:SAM-dependent methyltransferase
MPSVKWNLKNWTRDRARFLKGKPKEVYGVHWGDPELREGAVDPAAPGPLYRVVDDYIRPYVTSGVSVLEIGSGGGRWTRYLAGAARVICVDINDIFRPDLAEICRDTKFEFYKTSGFELSAVASDSVDFVFSFGTFVHIEPAGIEAYLKEIARVLKPGGIAVIQYADKTKPIGAKNSAFTNMNAQKMEKIVPTALRIETHDTTLLNHSNIIRLKKA